MADGNTILEFRLEEIEERYIPGVTKVQAAQHMQACLICLDHNRHLSAVEFEVKEKNASHKAQLYWEKEVDEQMRRGWRDLQEATEYGATAIAILLVIKTTEYTIIERSAKGLGFDYWLLEEELYDEDDLLPAGTARLEVSGMIHEEKDSKIRARVEEKVTQTKTSDDLKLPAIIVVVEFSRPEAHLVRRL